MRTSTDESTTRVPEGANPEARNSPIGIRSSIEMPYIKIAPLGRIWDTARHPGINFPSMLKSDIASVIRYWKMEQTEETAGRALANTDSNIPSCHYWIGMMNENEFEEQGRRRTSRQREGRLFDVEVSKMLLQQSLVVSVNTVRTG